MIDWISSGQKYPTVGLAASMQTEALEGKIGQGPRELIEQ